MQAFPSQLNTIRGLDLRPLLVLTVTRPHSHLLLSVPAAGRDSLLSPLEKLQLDPLVHRFLSSPSFHEL